jgi:hypothetical protein
MTGRGRGIQGEIDLENSQMIEFKKDRQRKLSVLLLLPFPLVEPDGNISKRGIGLEVNRRVLRLIILLFLGLIDAHNDNAVGCGRLNFCA